MVESQFFAETEDDPGDFELCVAVGGKVQHWWRDNRTANAPWQLASASGMTAGPSRVSSSPAQVSILNAPSSARVENSFLQA